MHSHSFSTFKLKNTNAQEFAYIWQRVMMRRSTKRDTRARQGQALYVSLLNDSDHDATHTADSHTMHSIPKVSHDDDDGVVGGGGVVVVIVVVAVEDTPA